MVSVLDYGLSSLGLSPVFLGKTLHSDSTSVHPGI